MEAQKKTLGKTLSLNAERLGLSSSKASVKRELSRLPSVFAAAPVPKPDTHRWLRWNLLWSVLLIFGLVPAPLWLYPLDCRAGWALVTGANLWLAAFLLLTLARAVYGTWRLHRAKHFPAYRLFYPKTAGKVDALRHLVVMCCYKEPLSLVQATLDTIKAQTEAANLFVVVGLEERTPDLDAKKEALRKAYDDGTFCGFLVTVHPKGLPGEIPGKCSNSNFATREGAKALWGLGFKDPELVTVTTLDADNLFPSRYFEFLGYDFFRLENRHEVIWQAPLLYNLRLDERPFFVRVTGILRSFLMLGALVPQDINTMSVFSMSLKLVEAGRWFHPAYQMDDIIYLLLASISIQKRVRIHLLPYPVLSGPTSGASLWEELQEWARQGRRWTVGAAEVFHYFCVKFRRFRLRDGLRYGLVFTHYYAFLLCAASLVNVSGLVASLVFAERCPAEEFLPRPWLVYAPLLGPALCQVVFGGMFVLDKLWVHYAGVQEHIAWWRNVLHWLATPLVLLAYSLVQLFALTKLALFGKDVCTHDPSTKTSLAPSDSSSASTILPNDPSIV